MTLRNVKLVILGSGTSAGVPVIGCDCGTCCSDDPRDRRLRPAACLAFDDSTGHERVILIGPRAQKAIKPFLQRDLNAFLFSAAEAEEKWRADKYKQRNSGRGRLRSVRGNGC